VCECVHGDLTITTWPDVDTVTAHVDGLAAAWWERTGRRPADPADGRGPQRRPARLTAPIAPRRPCRESKVATPTAARWTVPASTQRGRCGRARTGAFCVAGPATLDEGERMPKIVITHSVVDVDNWLQFKAERAAAIGGMGGTNVVDHVAQDESNTVAITADVEDVAGVLASISSPSPELGAAMERHGVVPPLSIYVEG